MGRPLGNKYDCLRVVRMYDFVREIYGLSDRHIIYFMALLDHKLSGKGIDDSDFSETCEKIRSWIRRLKSGKQGKIEKPHYLWLLAGICEMEEFKEEKYINGKYLEKNLPGLSIFDGAMKAEMKASHEFRRRKIQHKQKDIMMNMIMILRARVSDRFIKNGWKWKKWPDDSFSMIGYKYLRSEGFELVDGDETYRDIWDLGTNFEDISKDIAEMFSLDIDDPLITSIKKYMFRFVHTQQISQKDIRDLNNLIARHGIKIRKHKIDELHMLIYSWWLLQYGQKES